MPQLAKSLEKKMSEWSANKTPDKSSIREAAPHQQSLPEPNAMQFIYLFVPSLLVRLQNNFHLLNGLGADYTRITSGETRCAEWRLSSSHTAMMWSQLFFQPMEVTVPHPHA